MFYLSYTLQLLQIDRRRLDKLGPSQIFESYYTYEIKASDLQKDQR